MDWWDGGNNDMEDPSSWGGDAGETPSWLQDMIDGQSNPTDQRLAAGTQTTPGTQDAPTSGALGQFLKTLTGSDANNLMRMLLAGGTALSGFSGGQPTKSVADLRASVANPNDKFTTAQQAMVGPLMSTQMKAGNQIPRVYAADMQSPITQGYNAYSDAEVGKHLGIAQGQAPGTDLSVLRDKARSLYGITPTQFNRVANVPDSSATPPGGYTDERIRQTVAEARAANQGVTMDELRQRAASLGISAEQFNRAMMGVQEFASGGDVGGGVGGSGGGSMGGLSMFTSGMAGPVQGPGGGQEDLIDARLAAGEHVLDADLVSALGDGNNEAGHAVIEDWKAAIRGHKRSAPDDQIPPPAKGPLEYMRGPENGN